VRHAAVLVAVIAAAVAIRAQPASSDVEMRTLTYASPGGSDLVLDLDLPSNPRARCAASSMRTGRPGST
jgi:hypothetical protein